MGVRVGVTLGVGVPIGVGHDSSGRKHSAVGQCELGQLVDPVTMQVRQYLGAQGLVPSGFAVTAGSSTGSAGSA
jgi:hypothetical protein